MTGATAVALLLVRAALIGQDAAAPSPRYYELDVAARAQEALAPMPPPMTEDELAAALSENGFAGVVLWFAADDERADGTPEEPRARLLPPESPQDSPLAAAAAPFTSRGLAVAAGRRPTTEGGAPAPWSPAVAVELERGGAPATDSMGPLRLARAVRPGVRGWLWCDREAAQARARSGPFTVSSRLVARTLPALQAAQTKLDLLAFGLHPEPVAPPLLLQSRIASQIAVRLAGDDLHLVLPFENEWLGEPRAGPLASLRRDVPQLDLEEWCFSNPTAGGSNVESLLSPSTEPWLDFADDAPADGVATPPGTQGVLPLDESRRFAQMVNGRVAAARHALRFMVYGEREARDRWRAALLELRAQCEQLPDLSGPWLQTCAADAALLEGAEPWRLRTASWIVRSGPFSCTVTLVRVDDPRLGAWAPRIERALGGSELDLWQLLPVRAGLAVTFTTLVALRDPRNVRLRVDAAASRSIRVNGAVAVEPLAGSRGPLLATLPLPAGMSSLEVSLVLDEARGDVGLELDLLPNRVEGIVLDPDRDASRVREPAVKLHDPTALGQKCLVRPAGRAIPGSGGASASAAEGDGLASLAFPLTTAARYDVWVHVLPLADRPSTLALAFDEGVVQLLALAPGSSWTWVRAPAPTTLAAADHALQIRFPTENVRVDQAVLFASELTFPRQPDGHASMAASAWRFDPLGYGIVLDLPQLKLGEFFGRSFSLDKGGGYDVFVWMKGSDPLAPGQWATLELSAPSGRQRFVLPAGTPYEEWVALGSVNFAPDERIELKAQGHGALARVALVR